MIANHRPIVAAFGGLALVLLLSACSFKATFKETTDTTSNITGTTSGRIWWNEDGLLKPEHKVAAFTAYNADNPFAVPVGQVGGRKAGQTSYVLCHQPKSFDWRLCGGAPHPMKKISDARFAEALTILNQIVQLA